MKSLIHEKNIAVGVGFETSILGKITSAPNDPNMTLNATRQRVRFWLPYMA